MSNSFETDLHEMLESLSAGCLTESNHGCFPLDKITESLDDEYLMDKARYYLEYSHSHRAFENKLNTISELCIEERCEECPVRKYCNYYIKRCRLSVDHNSPKMVDLFCGAGGLSLGFIQAGFTVALANDIEDCCVDTYAHNHPEVERSRIVKGDINELISRLDTYIDFNSVSIIVGGPPCQGFSMANRQRLINDPRNHLYRSYVEVVRKVMPPFFVMENVKGMLSVANQVIEDFESVGYSVSAKVLNAKDFGVPQNRERLIYIGNRIGVDNNNIFAGILAASSKITKYVLADALYGLKPLSASRERNATERSSDYSGSRIMYGTGETNDYIETINLGKKTTIVYNHKARYNNDRDVEIFSRLNPGDRSDDPKIADIMPYSRRNGIFKDKYYKLEPDKVCKTITAHMKFDCNMYIHPSQARGLTPREAARVQSYPDDYYFRGAYTKTYMQIGNSVPPLMGRAIATAIKKYL